MNRLLITLLFILMSPPVLAQKELYFVSGEWVGYSEADGTGIFWDVVRETFSDYELRLEALPLARAKHEFSQGAADAIVGIYRENDYQAIYPTWYIDLEDPIIAIYDPRKHHITSTKDLGNLHLSWLNGYNFDSFFPLRESVYTVLDIENGFELLKSNRIDAFIDYAYNLPDVGMEPFATTELIPKRPIYIAFQNTPKGKDLAKQFDRNMARALTNGKLQALYSDNFARREFDKVDTNKRHILWLNNNPEFSTTVSRNFKKDTLVAIAELLNQYMLDYRMQELYAPVEAHPRILAQYDNSCSAFKIKTSERSEKYIFSDPIYFTPSIKLFFDPDKYPELSQESSIDSLVTLIDTYPDAVIAMQKSRAYGDAVEQQIARLGKANIYALSEAHPEIMMLDALTQGRIDFILDFPLNMIDIFKNYSDVITLKSASITSIPQFVFAYFMCSPSHINTKFINDLNEVMAKLYSDPQFLNALNIDFSNDELRISADALKQAIAEELHDSKRLSKK